ncbi:MAG: hypothetical protein HeimC3_53520 [Candidatus Heimdallarchaeota archaeon LC_3]|nr:MAG: hypothetical protein HeimC3_53520 [Candidatus Heimdallarchaeota archaeon LC_3]
MSLKNGTMTTVFNSEINCNEVTQGAISDGLSSVDCDDTCPPCPEKSHKVALVIWPGVDYHWYRQDFDGKWSHKPGGTPATNLDNSKNIILDPRQADRGNYTVFCGCFCSCQVLINIR